MPTSPTTAILRRGVFAFALLLGAGMPGELEAQGLPVETITAQQAAMRIQGERGKVRIVLLYAARCPYSRAMFSEFVRLAESYRKAGVSILAFSTDQDARIVQAYLGSNGLPFARIHIRPWRPGQLDAAMRPLGIDIGKTFGTPLIAVIDRKGQIVGQYEGESGARRADQWLRSLGLGPS